MCKHFRTKHSRVRTDESPANSSVYCGRRSKYLMVNAVAAHTKMWLDSHRLFTPRHAHYSFANNNLVVVTRHIGSVIAICVPGSPSTRLLQMEIGDENSFLNLICRAFLHRHRKYGCSIKRTSCCRIHFLCFTYRERFDVLARLALFFDKRGGRGSRRECKHDWGYLCPASRRQILPILLTHLDGK